MVLLFYAIQGIHNSLRCGLDFRIHDLIAKVFIDYALCFLRGQDFIFR